MTTLKNKILIKVNRKLIFIISILMIVALNLFGREEIEFEYYYYTNKIYHSTLKTEIIPSEYVFIMTYSNKDKYYNDRYENLYLYNLKYENLYLYNLKTKEKKLFYAYKTKINTNEHTYEVRTPDGYYYDTKTVTNYEYLYLNEYYDIKGNLTTNWTDTNMEANYFYKITNNRFGETFYNRIYYDNDNLTIRITKTNDYIQKAYKYSLTQPEIINKKDRGIYLFRKAGYGWNKELVSRLCFQNESYQSGVNGYHREEDLLNYDSNGRIIFDDLPECRLYFQYLRYFNREWTTFSQNTGFKDTIYFKLNDKTFIKPTWKEFVHNSLNYIKKEKGNKLATNFHYSKEDTERNTIEYKKLIDIDYIGFIPIEEFEYYLLAN